MLNKERIEKKNKEKAEKLVEETPIPSVDEIEEELKAESVKPGKVDHSGKKCIQCGRVLADVEGSGNKHGGLCGDCWKKKVS